MSSFMFATCDRRMALDFLKKQYPLRIVEDTPDSAGPILDLVAADLIRVQDPDFHQPCQIVAGKAYDEDLASEILQACQAFHDRVVNTDAAQGARPDER